MLASNLDMIIIYPRRFKLILIIQKIYWNIISIYDKIYYITINYYSSFLKLFMVCMRRVEPRGGQSPARRRWWLRLHSTQYHVRVRSHVARCRHWYPVWVHLPWPCWLGVLLVHLHGHVMGTSMSQWCWYTCLAMLCCMALVGVLSIE